MNIFEALREDHGVQRTLVDRLVETHGDTEQRDELFQEIKKNLKPMRLPKSATFISR